MLWLVILLLAILSMDNTPKKSLKGRLSLSNAAALLVGASFLSQLLGFLRTKLVNANFTAIGPHSTDAYFAAFNIPDFFYFTLAAGALGVAFMPVLAERLHKGDHKGIWELSDSLLNLLALIMLAVAIVILVFARPLIQDVVAPKLTAPQLHNAVIIMRLLAINPFLFTISGILSSVQQTYGRFFFYAIAPIFYNLSIIASIYVFKNNIGLVGLGVGALAGGIIQLVIVSIGLAKSNFRWRPQIIWHSSDFKRILRNLPPRSMDQGMDQIESIIETNFATRIGQGYVSYYANAYTLSTAPELLIGTAISTAVFPRLTLRLAQGRPDLFRKDFLRVLRVIIWITTPVVVVSYFSRGYLARMIFSRDSSEISLLFGYLTLAIFFRTIYTIVSRWFYAQNDTKTPLFVSIFTISLNVFLAWALTRPSTYGAVGLALAQSLVAMTEVLILFTIMLIRDHKLFDRTFINGVLRIFSVAGFSVTAAFIMISILPLEIKDHGFFVLGAKLALITVVTFSVHISVSALFGLEEAKTVLSRVKRIILRPIRLEY